jgi:uncharacterized protein (DUF1697 family)
VQSEIDAQDLGGKEQALGIPLLRDQNADLFCASRDRPAAPDKCWAVNLLALVVFLRGINVGGHRTFRPTKLAEALKHLGAVNIGAAGTLVIRQPMTQAEARAEVARNLPFAAEIVVCQGRDIASLISKNPFEGQSVRPDVVHFISVLSQRPRLTPSTPMRFPPSGQWLMKILARRNRFVIGMYRRHMKVIGFLGALDRLYGVPVTTRNWNTIAAIAKVLRNDLKKS